MYIYTCAHFDGLSIDRSAYLTRAQGTSNTRLLGGVRAVKVRDDASTTTREFRNFVFFPRIPMMITIIINTIIIMIAHRAGDNLDSRTGLQLERYSSAAPGLSLFYPRGTGTGFFARFRGIFTTPHRCHWATTLAHAVSSFGSDDLEITPAPAQRINKLYAAARDFFFFFCRVTISKLRGV